MLVEHGFVRAEAADGREWTFTPSLGRVAFLGTPAGIVETFGALHGDQAAAASLDVLACFGDDAGRGDLHELIGWRDEAGLCDGLIPESERVILARHLMQHAVSGRPDPKAKRGEAGDYAREFSAGEFISLARAHLGLSSADAAALSMTELQQLMKAKFPPEKTGARPTPISREAYAAGMARARAMRDKRAAQ